MEYTIYFTDKELVISDLHYSSEALQGRFVLALQRGEHIARAKILKIFETANRIVVLTPDSEQVFLAFSREFKMVDAAGGVVRREDGSLVMIHRRGRWDLPKGHWEEGESFEQCALRETEEETGVRADRVVRKLCVTMHSYNTYGTWELKSTHWYLLEVDGDVELRPQAEEDISQARWVSLLDARRLAEESFPTIREVIAQI